MLISSSVVDVSIFILTFHWFLPVRRQKSRDSNVSSTPQGHLRKIGTAKWPVDNSSTPHHFPSIFHQLAQTLIFGVQHCMLYFPATSDLFWSGSATTNNLHVLSGHFWVMRAMFVYINNNNNKDFLMMMMMSWCLMSSDVIWHIRDKLWPMPKHGSIKSTYVRCMRV